MLGTTIEKENIMSGYVPPISNAARFKHPRTFHLPWSKSLINDDKEIETLAGFLGRHVVVTEKRDGECTTLYKDGYIHARSIDGNGHPWQDHIKAQWRNVCWMLPDGYRVIGENLYASHSIPYDNLEQYFEVFAIVNHCNKFLSWYDTAFWAKKLSLITVPVLTGGEWDQDLLIQLADELDPETQEGYVVRVESSIAYDAWRVLAAKYVREKHVQSDEMWWKTWVPNKLKR